MLLFFNVPDADGSGHARLTVTPDGAAPEPRRVPTEKWMWGTWIIETGDRPFRRTWVTVETQPTWNSGLSGFPSDLGVLISSIAVVPAD